METPSPEGAAAAASYFMALYPYIYATGDLEEWSALSEPDCQFCANTRASVEEQFARGAVGGGSAITVESANGTEISPGAFYSADLVITQDASYEVSKDGTRTPVGEGGRFRLHFALAWESGWLVRAVDATRE